jgi:hypothetical protein
MPRKSLRPHLNQIRAWVRQGRTDAWVAHQLDVSVREIDQFKRQNELVETDDAAASTDGYPDEIDLRAEDDALIAAELEAAEAEAERAKAEAEAEAEAERLRREAEGPQEGAEDDGATRTRRRTRRGGRARKAPSGARATTGPLEGTFDHGEEGYGLWLDPAIQDNPVYAEYWAGHRPVEVAVEEDQIVIRRAGGED